jgi:hypothetical protein
MTTAQFTTPLEIRKIGPRRWMLINDLHFQSERYWGTFVVPRGFQTDFASIPSVLGSLFPIVGAYDPVAVVHDAGYMHALTTLSGTRVHTVKHVADNLFAEGLEAVGVGWLRRRLMTRMVRLFGDPLTHPLANALPPAPPVELEL